MRKTVMLLIIAMLIGCAHVPTAEFCEEVNKAENPEPCIPYVCYGYEKCGVDAAILLTPVP